MSPEETQPAADPRLTELALRWEELCDQGQEVTLESLCRDSPELIEPLRQRIRTLRDMDAVLQTRTQAAPNVGPATEPVPNAAAPPGGPHPQLPPSNRQAPTRPAYPQIPGYEILGELGRGGMGVVYKARQTKLNRIVALKMILPGRQPHPDELARFRREVEAIACLRHPNLIGIYEVGEYEGLPFYALEYMDGGSLDKWVGDRPQPPRQAAELVETLARAIHIAHQSGIVHRDLKPGNILLEVLAEKATPGSSPTFPGVNPQPTTIPKITDFGLARRFNEVDGPTQTGDILGTPSYMAPEQALGKSRDVGPPADIYALGAILYKLLTGRPPFQGDTSWNTIHMVLAGEVVAPRHLQPSVPQDLQTICLKCLEREPAKRYASALDLAEDLRRFLANEPVRARPVGPVGRLWRWSRRHPAVSLLLMGILASVLATIVVFVVYNFRLQKALADAKDYAERNRRGLVFLHVARGARLLEEGDNYRALIWFAEALRLEEGNPEAEEAHRIRLAVTFRQCPRLLQLWRHGGPVQQAVFSPDGALVLTASDDQTARLWDAATGAEVVGPLRHDGPVLDASFRPDGLAVVTASADGTARIWSVTTGRELTPPLQHGGPLNRAAFSARGRLVVTAGKDGTARLWDPGTGQSLGEPLKHDGPVVWAAFNPEGNEVVTASDDKTARLWKIEDTRKPGQKEGGFKVSLAFRLEHQGAVKDAIFSPDGKRVLTASADGTAGLWDAANGQLLHTLKHRQTVVQAQFSPDGKRIATASDDHTACLWDATTGARQGDPLRHLSGLNAVAFSPDSQLVATASDDSSGRVWGAAAEEALTPLLRHNGSLNAIAFSPDGRRLVTAGNDQLVRLWDLSALPAPSTAPLEPSAGSPAGRWLSPDGKKVAVKESDLVVRVCDAITNTPIGPELTHGSTVHYAAFSPDGTRLVTASDDNSAYVWNWKTGELLTVPLDHNGGVSYAAFSPDGRFVVTVCDDGTARVWDPRTGFPLTPPLRFRGHLDHLTFNAEGTQLTMSCKEMKGIPDVSWDLRPTDKPLDQCYPSPSCCRATGSTAPAVPFLLGPGGCRLFGKSCAPATPSFGRPPEDDKMTR